MARVTVTLKKKTKIGTVEHPKGKTLDVLCGTFLELYKNGSVDAPKNLKDTNPELYAEIKGK